MILTVFEESKGELRCLAYLPGQSVMLDLLVNASNLGQCVPNLDRGRSSRQAAPDRQSGSSQRVLTAAD